MSVISCWWFVQSHGVNYLPFWWVTSYHYFGGWDDVDSNSTTIRITTSTIRSLSKFIIVFLEPFSLPARAWWAEFGVVFNQQVFSLVGWQWSRSLLLWPAELRIRSYCQGFEGFRDTFPCLSLPSYQCCQIWAKKSQVEEKHPSYF